MNWQALFDALLAGVALTVAWRATGAPALRLACSLLGAAAVLGTLRFSGWMPLPSLHQLVSMLGATVALPLLAAAVIWPEGAVALQRRSAWIFAVVSATLGLMIVVQAGFKPWSTASALLAVVGLLSIGLRRRDWTAAAGGACLLAALLAFAAQVRLAGFQPGDFLHLGMATGLWLLGRWSKRRRLGERRLPASA
jgi:hypothetical protein